MINKKINSNFSKVTPYRLIFPLSIIGMVVLFLYFNSALNHRGYIDIQDELFLYLNEKLSVFPYLQTNLTLFGDALILLSLVCVLFPFTPKIWEALIPSSLFSLLFSQIPKMILAVPRPAASLKQEFYIIGEKLTGHNSCPSGHSITIISIISVLFIGFYPKEFRTKIFYTSTLVMVGISVAITRIGVGAHYPLDVFLGCILGYICSILGILFTQKFSLFRWISNPKFLPIFITLFIICAGLLIHRIIHENLIVYYFPLISLGISLFIIIQKYVRFIKK